MGLVYNYASSWTPPTSCPSPSSVPTSGSGNDGNVMGYWYQDNVNPSLSHTATHTYDTLNRLSTSAATGSALYNLTFAYDRYGNMACQTNGQTNGLCPNWTYNGNNQISTAGYTYDGAGHVTADGTHTYQWDAEGRLISVDSGATASMMYNGLGQMAQRVLPSSPAGWQAVGYQYDASGRPIGGSIPAYPQVDTALALPGGGIVYYMYPWNLTLFAHANALGTTSQSTLQSGALSRDLLYYPWGQPWADLGTDYWEQNFAGQEMTMPESGLNETPFRMYNPYQGRWMSPDPLGGDLINPQSLNRYPYVLNNPQSNVDPLGLACYPEFEGDDCLGLPPCDPGDPSCDPGCDPTIEPCGPIVPPHGGGGGGRAPSPPPGTSSPVPPAVGFPGNLGFPQSGFPGNAGFPQIGGIPQQLVCLIFPLTCIINGTETGMPFPVPIPPIPVATIVVQVNGSARTSSQQNAAATQPAQGWNFSHPSPAVCGNVKTVMKGTVILGGLSLLGSMVFAEIPPVAAVLEGTGEAAAINFTVFGLYYVAFCR
jgi:RHS repeat-associated protein